MIFALLQPAILKKFIFATVVAALLILQPAMAAAPSNQQQIDFANSNASTTYADAFRRIEQTTAASAEEAQSRLVDIGSKLLAVLAFISLSWQMGMMVIEGGNMSDYIGNFLRIVFLISFAFWMMPGPGGQGAILNFLQSLTGDVAGAIAGTDGGLGDIIGQGMSKFFQGFADIGNQIGKIMADGAGDSVLPAGMAALGVFFANIPTMLFLVAAAIIMLVAAIIYFVMAVMAIFMTQLAVIVAPIFIPWLVLGVTSWVFDGWLRFMISACLYKVVGAAIMTLGNGVLASTIGDIGQVSFIGALLQAILTASVACALAYMMLQLTGITQGLLNGNGALAMGRMVSRLAGAAQMSGAAGLAGAGAATRAASAVASGSAAKALSQGMSSIRVSAASAMSRAVNTVQFTKKANAAPGGGVATAKALMGAARDSVVAGGKTVATGLQSATVRALSGAGDSLSRSAKRNYADSTGSSTNKSLTLRKM